MGIAWDIAKHSGIYIYNDMRPSNMAMEYRGFSIATFDWRRTGG